MSVFLPLSHTSIPIVTCCRFLFFFSLFLFFFLVSLRLPRSTLSSSSAASDVYKRQELGSGYMKQIQSEIIVIGGGLAGICAAIAAAREGKQVVLIQNRGVLGGNSSSEIRVWVCGATKHGVNRYARETGIMGELFLENQFRNPQGNVFQWNLLLLEKVKEEQNIQLYLNTEVIDVTVEGHTITSVIARTQGAENTYQFLGEYFIDCTGDGIVGEGAKAEFHMGRESREMYDESLAPEVADDRMLGSTLLFYTKDTGEKTKFIAPSFAKKITDTTIIKNRTLNPTDNGCAYWWIEWGGELDTIHDNEKIRDELLSVVYGIWDHIKNSGEYEADTLDLEWIGTCLLYTSDAADEEESVDLGGRRIIKKKKKKKRN